MADPERLDGSSAMAKERAFYGRRKSKALSARQQGLFDELLPKLLIDLAQPRPSNISDLFAHKPDHVVMEIGFGGGEHLIDHASRIPSSGYIGIEPFVNSMAKALSSIESIGLQNIRLYDDDAVFLLDWLPSDSIDQIDLLYPDPWPKKRHWKRRFVNIRNLDRFNRILKPGGRFRFASDIDSYNNWTLNHLHEHGAFRWLAECASDWKTPWEGWHSTRYEAKAGREGRVPAYLQFAKR